MAHREHGNAFNDVMELLIENGFDGMAKVLRILLNEAMKVERVDALAAGAYQRTPERKGYANGFKPKTVDTRMGRITVDVPQVRGDVEFYPSALEKGCRSERALQQGKTATVLWLGNTIPVKTLLPTALHIF